MENVNEKNLKYLKDQVFNTGFGEEDPEKLKALMARGLDRFVYPFEKKYGSDTVKVDRHFSLSDKGNYFFNTFSVSVEREGAEPIRNTFNTRRPEKVVSQREGLEPKDWINSTITLKEAYNLLKGRPVLKDYLTKEGEHFKSWTKVDMTQRDKYGNFVIERLPYFDISPDIRKLPIKDIEKEGVLEKIVESVHKGNRQSVDMVASNGMEVGMFVGPNLKKQEVTVFSSFTSVPRDWQAHIEKAALLEAKDSLEKGAGNDILNDKGINSGNQPVQKEGQKEKTRGNRNRNNQNAGAEGTSRNSRRAKNPKV